MPADPPDLPDPGKMVPEPALRPSLPRAPGVRMTAVRGEGFHRKSAKNGVLVATTGYANTVTTSGTLTDIGLLIGGVTHGAGRSEEKLRKGLTLPA